MGYLVTLLALARFYALEPSSAPTEDPPAAPTEARSESVVHGQGQGQGADHGALRPIVFLPRVGPHQAAPRDLRNPFDAPAARESSRERDRRVKSVTTSASTKEASADLRDPFATEPKKRHRFDAAPDLRDPFAQPQRSLPKCPDTGDVPIQRPEGATPGCKQASRRRTVLAHR